MSMPLVSFCCGTYNREKYVREAMDSLLAQTYAPAEIIIVDDASTDGTLAILESYGDRIRLIRRKVNSGICPVTRNQAVRAARGKYVAFLDSDDKWYPEKTARQVEFMEAHPDMPLSHTYCHVMDADSKVLGVRHAGGLPATGFIFERLLEHCWITISSVMVRRDLFSEVGYFNPDPPYGYLGEDWEFFLRVARRYPIGLIEDVLAAFRKAEQGITAANWKAHPRAVPFYFALLSRPDIWKGIVSRRRVLDAMADACRENGSHARDRGQIGRAFYFAGAGLARHPFSRILYGQLMRTLFRALVRRP